MLNLPEAFIDLLPIDRSEQTDFIEALNDSPPVSLRMNPLKARSIGAEDRVSWSEHGVYLNERPRYTSDPAFHAGAYYPQEASSMFLEKLIKELGLDQSPITALDLCAAPGGKSTLLRQILDQDSLLVANEVIQSRVKLLEENLTKWGQPGILVTNSDPKHLKGLGPTFDLIVVDAPCSGEGMFRKQPDSIYQWSLDSVKLCASRQRRILSDTWASLKPGGVLIYSTCTYNRFENEENIEWLINEQSALPIDLSQIDCFGARQIEVEGINGFQFMPHLTKGEGFFIAAVQKDGVEKSTKNGKNKSRLEIHQVSGTSEKYGAVSDHQGNSFLVNRNHTSSIEHVSSKLRTTMLGFPIGRLIRDREIKWNHGAAMLSNLNLDIPRIDLELVDALRFLQKQDIKGLDALKGLTQVFFEGFSLGLGRVQQNRLISNYPTNWRIRRPVPEEYRRIVESVNL